MDSTAVEFLAGALVATVGLMIVGPLYVFKPRLDDLIRQRNEWRDRAIAAEDSAMAREAHEVAILGHFGPPAPPNTPGPHGG